MKRYILIFILTSITSLYAENFRQLNNVMIKTLKTCPNYGCITFESEDGSISDKFIFPNNSLLQSVIISSYTMKIPLNIEYKADYNIKIDDRYSYYGITIDGNLLYHYKFYNRVVTDYHNPPDIFFNLIEIVELN